MTFEQIISDIHKKKYAPIYFLMGEEPYFIDMISDTIEDEVLDETEKAFNQIVVYGRDVDIDTVAQHAKSFSMMGGYMVVIVKEAQDLKNIEDFEKYLEVIPPTTILVFDYKYKKLDKRRALAKKIDKMGVLFESKKLYDNNIPGWIQGYLNEKGYGITPKAMQMLADFLGTDLHKIRNERYIAKYVFHYLRKAAARTFFYSLHAKHKAFARNVVLPHISQKRTK